MAQLASSIGIERGALSPIDGHRTRPLEEALRVLHAAHSGSTLGSGASKSSMRSGRAGLGSKTSICRLSAGA